MKRLLITGAAGGIGSIFRQRLQHLAEIIRVSDRTDLGPAAAHEEVILCNLEDRQAVEDLVEGCDGIVHMGGQPVEASWEVVKASNIEGMFNLYEAARKHKVKRIIFASSNHAIGFYRQDEKLDAFSLPRPDGLYGVSKVFGEALASMYHDKFGIETACVRIGSFFPEPVDHRMLSTWLSADDFVGLVEKIFQVPRLGCPIIYGASANDASWWDNHAVSYIGWHPKDNSEQFRSQLDARMSPPDKQDARAYYQGGVFTQDGIHE